MRGLARVVVAALLLPAARSALADPWSPAEVAEAQRLQREEVARAAAYRERVARGDVRTQSAPMPRSAPQTPGEPSPGDALRDAADIADSIERWFRRTRAREERRRRGPEPPSDGAGDWWEEEQRRLGRER